MEINKKENYLLKVKKYLAVFMSILMIMSTMGLAAFAAEVEPEGYGEYVTGGNCGSADPLYSYGHIEWVLYDDGTLVFSGEGDMEDYYHPWLYADTEIKRVIFEEGITTVGDYAFINCSTLESVELCDTIEYIGSYAFENCISLTSIEFPEGLKSINWGSFNSCTALTSVFIPKDVYFISDGAFAYCDGITEFIVDEDNETYFTDENGALYTYDYEYSCCCCCDEDCELWLTLIAYPGGNEAEEYTIEEKVQVYEEAFSGAVNLKKLIVADDETTFHCYDFGSIETIVGHYFSGAYYAAYHADLEFVDIDGRTVSDVELTKLPYQLEYETVPDEDEEYFYLELAGMEITMTLSDGSKIVFKDGDGAYATVESTAVGTQKVNVEFEGKTFSFDVEFYPERTLVAGKERAFNVYSGHSGGERADFYFTPEKDGKYIVTLNMPGDGEIYYYEWIKGTYYDEELDEEYEYEGWSCSDTKTVYKDDDITTMKLDLKAGKKYRIGVYSYSQWDEETGYSYEPVPATIKIAPYCEHKNTKAHAQQNPTCTQVGYTAGTYCEDCKTWAEGHITIEALGHTSDEGIITKYATCSAAGTKTYSCIFCRTTLKTETVAATGKHVSDAGTVTKAATYDAEGVKTYKCTVCNAVIKTEAIAKLAKPAKPAKAKLKTAKSLKKKKATVTWAAVKDANGYQVAYSTSKKFAKKTTKTALIKKAKTTKTTLKKLTSGKKYFVKVRAYKTVDGKKLFGAYSKVKTVKIK